MQSQNQNQNQNQNQMVVVPNDLRLQNGAGDHKRPASPSSHSPNYLSGASSPGGSSVASPVSSSGVSSSSSSAGLLLLSSELALPELGAASPVLSWFHAANSRARLSAALASEFNPF